MKPKQLALIQKMKSAYGGELMNKRKGRQGPRPLSTRYSMHLVLRSEKAKGPMSFRVPRHSKAIRTIVEKFARKYGVQVVSLANVGNHLHFQIRLGNRFAYKPFIRAVTAAIAMAVGGVSRWNKSKGKFWDYRPFTRIVDGGLRAILQLRDYIRLNQLEGFGFKRDVARLIVREEFSSG